MPIINPSDNKSALLEVKAFDYDAGPNFDIANFDAYTRSLRVNAYRLDADYLIFGYTMDSEGIVEIKDLWLKKIWDISGPCGNWGVRVQVKQGVIVNIRPVKWYNFQRCKYKPFGERSKFVSGLSYTLLKYTKRMEDSGNWLKVVSGNYKEHTGKDVMSPSQTYL
jgi:hypothetical protein